MNDTPRSILNSAKHFFSGTMLSRITGMLRDISLAFAFGTSSALAAFLVAFRFAHLLRRLLGEGAFQTAFIPNFEKLRSHSPGRAGRFFIDLYASLTPVLLGIVLAGMAACALFIHSAPTSDQSEIIWLALLMLPSLLFICLFGLNASLLQCEGHFFLPAAAPVTFNLFWIIGALGLKGLAPEIAMPYLALFINVACFSQWIITVPSTWKILNAYGSDLSWKLLRPFCSDVRSLCRPLFLGMIGVGAAQINSALDSLFARYASAEGPAYLWYAIRLQQLPLALIGIALSGALLPALSRANKSQDRALYRQLLHSTMKSCLLIMLPITLGIFLFGHLAIISIYGHGNFSALSVLETTHCLWGYAIGLIPMAAILILAPGFYAQSDYRTPMQAAVAAMILNATLSGWFVVGLGWGAASVALATSLSAWLNCLWLVLKAGLKDEKMIKAEG